MAKLLLKPAAGRGRIHKVTPESAGWTYVGFEVHRLAAGEAASAATGEREACLVLVSGKARVEVDGESFGEIGGRMSPFEGKPSSVYVPAGSTWRAAATTALELAVCSAPGRRRPRGAAHRAGQDRESRRAAPARTPATSRTSCPRPSRRTASLSSRSSRRRATGRAIRRTSMTGTRCRTSRSSRRPITTASTRPQGYAVQRVYTDDRSLDETMAVEDRDVVLVPRGYHPVGAPHGYVSIT